MGVPGWAYVEGRVRRSRVEVTGAASPVATQCLGRSRLRHPARERKGRGRWLRSWVPFALDFSLAVHTVSAAEQPTSVRCVGRRGGLRSSRWPFMFWSLCTHANSPSSAMCSSSPCTPWRVVNCRPAPSRAAYISPPLQFLGRKWACLVHQRHTRRVFGWRMIRWLHLLLSAQARVSNGIGIDAKVCPGGRGPGRCASHTHRAGNAAPSTPSSPA